ncbi:hypothetical protein CIW83_09990 [Tissierella sp. P1]|uniref:DUF881 domain-containing protein n=1 Tax=Tissierella sp. P1 TaxID=1280483 RepID=UPI000BA04C4E|nr:DUF881 domain-containing protein [Tissierella sp. P1]OZV12408.1 hypothetical protein CIW83_09990 [Tissierella sp. P1]
MKNNNPRVILTLFSIIIGIFIATQIKMKLETYAPVTLKSLQATKAEIISINNEISELNKLIKMKEEELELLENIAKGDDNIIDILLEQIKYNKIHSGRTDLKGPGVVITMYDNPEETVVGFDINDDVIHDVDILNIINDLRIAGAEAISINGEMVLATSEIKCGGPTIRINGRSSATPFVIKAIGDPKLLYAAVNAPGTYGDILKNVYQIGFEPEIQDSITIPGFTRAFNFKYAKKLGEGD